ncbi:class I SAM-dependent methyltransferase [Patescibacteria group bacterium]|nr:class I SAM-dependent methyltransferase [Patescibacteria group bacterium]
MNLQALIKHSESEENSKIRAQIWGDFVSWDNRRKGEDGFLINQLRKYNARKILDVALGDGVDTIYLLSQGFDVSSNEVDDAFREKAIENAKKSGFEIEPTSLNWRYLSKSYQPSSFDAVICLGNSLTCVYGKVNQLECLKQFYSVLKPGGVLLIDERNYQRILDNREKALSGELHSSGKYLYTGTNKVKASFKAITDEDIIIEYVHLETDKKACYLVHPFLKGGLIGLLKEAGFLKIEQYSDYELGDNPQADFYQYVCIK